MSEWDDYWKSKSFKRKFVEFMRSVWFAPMFTSLVKKFHKNGRILEAGCGSGKYLKYFKDAYGIDNSKESVKIAKKYCNNIVLGDIFHLPFKNKFFDIVFNQGVMEHFTDDEWDKILKEFKRVSNKACIILPSKYSPFRIFNPFKDEGYERFFSRKDAEVLMKKHFKKVKSGYLLRSFLLSMYVYGEN